MNTISRTAKDALQAKLSAYNAGYRPGVRNTEVYGKLLTSMGKTLQVDKRQTPLVNIGYAVRVAVVLQQIQAFVSFHRNQPLQIVLLGAGLDVTGLWSLTLAHNINVIEVDLLDICEAKTEAISHLNALQVENTSNLTYNESFVLHGSSLMSASSKYSLVAVDLTRIDAVKDTLSYACSNLPSLVVSELVLAYLGEAACDDLLRWCATDLCQPQTSCLVAWEPLGPRSVKNTYSVVEEYKRSYYQQFVAKLERGETETRDASAPNFCAFHPLGSSCQSIERRLDALGFSATRGATAGKAAVEARREGAVFNAKELFDEHAALTLHLRSYCLVCTFSSNCEHSLFRRIMCPWTTDVRPCLFERPDAGSDLWLTTVEVEDDQQVRDLFVETYQPLFQEHPVIHKMVKSVLKKDFASPSGQSSSESSIGGHYRSLGGQFIVAIQYSSNGDTCQRRVLGGIAVRRCGEKEGGIRGAKPESFEIQRLFVSSNVRGNGVGTALLEAVKEFVCQRSRKGFHLLATTVEVLEAANGFYQRLGFEVKEEDTVGGLLMRTYGRSYPPVA